MPSLWLLSAAVRLRVLTGLAMADYVGPLTVGTGQDLVKHESLDRVGSPRLQRHA